MAPPLQNLPIDRFIQNRIDIRKNKFKFYRQVPKIISHIGDEETIFNFQIPPHVLLEEYFVVDCCGPDGRPPSFRYNFF